MIDTLMLIIVLDFDHVNNVLNSFASQTVMLKGSVNQAYVIHLNDRST